MKKAAMAVFYWYTVPVIIAGYLTCAFGFIAALVIAGIAAGAIMFINLQNSRIRILCVAALAGVVAGIAAMAYAVNDRRELLAYIKADPEISCAAVTVADNECSPASRYLPPPTYIRVKVETGGKSFYAYLSANRKDFRGVPGWGDTYLVTGRFSVPRNFTQLPTLNADDLTFVAGGESLFRKLLDIRDRIMDHVTSDFGDTPQAVKARGIVAALIFGCCQGVSREVMDDFAITGTIHILSVSGLHIAVLAAAVSFLMMAAGVRFRVRCILAPAVLLPYLVMTGCSIPAMRAWFMFVAWSMCRCFLLKTPPVRILLLIAAVTALISPLDLLNMGFQYSFAVTAALLLLMPVLKEVYDLLEVDRRWLLPGRIREKYSARFDKISRGFVNTVLAAVTAFAAGIPLTLFYNGRAAFVSVMLNIFIAPLLPLAYIGALAAVIIPFEWGGVLCKWSVILMSSIIDCTGNTALVPSGLGRPGWMLAAAGTAGILMMLASGSGRKLRLPGILLFGVFFAGCFIKPLSRPPQIAVFVPAYTGRPSIAAYHPAFPGRRGIFIAGDLDRECRMAAEDFFFANGVTEIDNLIIPVSSKDTWYQCRRLAAAVPVKTVIIPEKMRKSSVATEALNAISPAAVYKKNEPAGNFSGHALQAVCAGDSCRIMLDDRVIAEIDGISNHARQYIIPLPDLRIQ